MPCARSLFETINGLLKMTQMRRARRILKARGLSHKDFLLKNTIQKCILNIKLA
jgi:hypothetical protein